MELVDMTEEELTNVFMVHFPATMQLDECRERLELEIYMLANKMGENVDSEESTVCISPVWVWMAISEMQRREPGWTMDPEYVKRFRKRDTVPQSEPIVV